MKTYLTALFCLLLLISCQKYDDTKAAANLQVPPYTETGANTFGCLLNGAPWANFGATVVGTELGFKNIDTNKVISAIYFSAPDSIFTVSGTLGIYKQGVVVRLERMSFNVIKSGNLKAVHQLTAKNSGFSFTNTYYNTYYSLARNPFTIIINKDSTTQTLKHIVSGMFNGIIYNNAQTDSLRVVGGVFDVTVNRQ